MNETTTIEDLEASNFSDEASILVKWVPERSIPLILTVSVMLVIGIFSRGAIINFIWKATPNRPISFNILVDQMIELPTFVIMTSLMLTSLVTAKPIDKIFGPLGSGILWISMVFHNLSLTVGGCGVAVYRYICVQDFKISLDIIRAKQLMNQIIKAELVLEILMTIANIIGGVWSNQAMGLMTAKGYSTRMENIINPKTNEVGVWMITGVGVLVTSLIMVELTCYACIYVQLYRNDEKMKTSFSKEQFQFRRRRNALSLSTQVIGTLVELVGGITGSLIISLQIMDSSGFLLISSMTSALVSALHVVGSMEMRKYYNLFH